MIEEEKIKRIGEEIEKHPIFRNDETVMTVKFGHLLSESDKKEWRESVESLTNYESFVQIKFVTKLRDREKRK